MEIIQAAKKQFWIFNGVSLEHFLKRCLQLFQVFWFRNHEFLAKDIFASFDASFC